MGVLLIIAGVVLFSWAAGNHRRIESQRAVIFTGPIGQLIHAAVTFGGIGLVIWGVVRLFA